MPKKKPAQVAGNARKYWSYREAFGRIRGAMGHGYYLEAITIEESIISDRLRSYVVKIGQAPPARRFAREPLAALIQRWRSLVTTAIADAHFDDLQASIDAWRRRRNELIHGMVKSHPGTAPISVDEFLREARETAQEGERLAKSLRNWHDREARRLKWPSRWSGERAT